MVFAAVTALALVTAAITPGNPPTALVSSSAVCSWAVVEASRAFVGLGSGVAPVPGVEVGLVDPQPALTSTRTSTAQTEPRVYVEVAVIVRSLSLGVPGRPWAVSSFGRARAARAERPPSRAVKIAVGRASDALPVTTVDPLSSAH